MALRWLLRTVVIGLTFAVFYGLLDRSLDPALLRGFEIASILALAVTLAITGAAVGAARIDTEGRVLDWLLDIQLSVLICLTFRALEGVIDATLLRGLASVTLVTAGGCAASIAGSVLVHRRARSRRVST